MTHKEGDTSFGSTVGPGSESGLLAAVELASHFKSRWQHGEPPDVVAVLAEHTELRRYKSVALDLASCEYFHRVAAGESLDVDEFAQRFPTLYRSLYMMIEVQRLLDEDPGFRTLREIVSWPKPGDRLLGFSLIAELGRGTFARVFLASEPALGDRLVALKVAPEGGEEAEMLGKLRHPNIVPVYSVQEEPRTGLTAVCMPYLGRATLSDVLDRAFAAGHPPASSRVILDTIQDLSDDRELFDPSSFDRALRSGSYVDAIVHLGAQLADALAYTHSRGICHGDLKPSNVLLSPDGRPLLLDFNLSFDRRVNARKVGGTLPYMAPEQLASVILEVPDCQPHADPRSDLFSLGVVLYELLSGALPFGALPRGDSLGVIAEGLGREQAKGPRPLREKNRQVNKEVAELIEGCLAFDPKERPQGVAEVAIAFSKQLAPLRRAGRWLRDHRAPAGLVASLLLTIVLGGIAFLLARDPYFIRHYNRGRAYAERGEYELAVKCFDNSIRANPDYSDALFARGRAYQKLGNFHWAFEDFEAAFRRAPTARIAACKGYCLTRLNHHEEAIDSYRNALNMGYDSPAVLNNIGFSYMRLGQVDNAETYLRRAIEADSGLQVAHHNLLLVFLNRCRHGQPIPHSALVQASKAAELGRPSADLYYCVAALYALASQKDPSLVRPAREHLEKAVAHGLDPGKIKSDPVFSPFRGQQAFDALLSKPPPADPPPKADLLIDPL